MPDFSYCKLEIFVPASHFSAVQTALAESDAGHIGAYDQCLSYSGEYPLPGRRIQSGSDLSDGAGRRDHTGSESRAPI